MPHTRRTERRKHLIILLIALVLALAVLLIWAESVSAILSADERPAGLLRGADSSDVVSAQLFTTERLLILGMLGLIAATYVYLRLRPPYDPDERSSNEPE